ncbi:MAG: hypothetical protein DRN71_04320 [Candidatus Nanohalarchaeota archaeon]|nr:MAG: hypothetical protein DRN71_04320 [Candidatus Nanohaloarchaeota archaeon]
MPDTDRMSLKEQLDLVMGFEDKSSDKFIKYIQDPTVGNEYAEKVFAKDNVTLYLVTGENNANTAPTAGHADAIAKMTIGATDAVVRLLSGAEYIEKAVEAKDVGAIDSTATVGTGYDPAEKAKYEQEISTLKADIDQLSAICVDAEKYVTGLEQILNLGVTHADVINYILNDGANIPEIQKGVESKYVLATKEEINEYETQLLSEANSNLEALTNERNELETKYTDVVVKYNDALKTIGDLEAEYREALDEIDQLKAQISDMEQYTETPDAGGSGAETSAPQTPAGGSGTIVAPNWF